MGIKKIENGILIKVNAFEKLFILLIVIYLEGLEYKYKEFTLKNVERSTHFLRWQVRLLHYMSFINSIGTAVPEYKYRQDEIADFMIDYIDGDDRISRMIKILYAKSAIKQRHSVVPDFSMRYGNHYLFNGTQANLSKRMQLFGEEAPELALKASVMPCTMLKLKVLPIWLP